MEWREDPEFWELLDNLTKQTWPHLKAFLDCCQKHTIDPIGSTFLFGILGKFVAFHRKSIEEDLLPEESLARAIEAVYTDPRFLMLQQQSVNNAIDQKVGGMVE